MTIFVDSREKARAIEKILATFDLQGVKHISNKLYVGDYQLLENPLLVIDRKQNLNELANNVCQHHRRFAAELQRAKDAGIHIVILVEHSWQVRTIDDVRCWVNPRIRESPLAMSGERLHKILCTMKAHYDVDFQFCAKSQTGQKIIDILKDGR